MLAVEGHRTPRNCGECARQYYVCVTGRRNMTDQSEYDAYVTRRIRIRIAEEDNVKPYSVNRLSPSCGTGPGLAWGSAVDGNQTLDVGVQVMGAQVFDNRFDLLRVLALADQRRVIGLDHQRVVDSDQHNDTALGGSHEASA